MFLDGVGPCALLRLKFAAFLYFVWLYAETMIILNTFVQRLFAQCRFLLIMRMLNIIDFLWRLWLFYSCTPRLLCISRWTLPKTSCVTSRYQLFHVSIFYLNGTFPLAFLEQKARIPFRNIRTAHCDEVVSPFLAYFLFRECFMRFNGLFVRQT